MARCPSIARHRIVAASRFFLKNGGLKMPLHPRGRMFHTRVHSNLILNLGSLHKWAGKWAANPFPKTLPLNQNRFPPFRRFKVYLFTGNSARKGGPFFLGGGKPYPAAYARFFITPLPKHFRDPFPPFSHHKGGTLFLTPILLFD